MLRSRILIPVLVLGAGLFFMNSSANAQVNVSVRFGQPAYRPAPFVVRPAPVVVAPQIAPVYPYPVYRPAPVVVPAPHHQHYRVMYRDCAHDPWQVYRVFHNHERAHDVAASLRFQGLEAYVSHN